MNIEILPIPHKRIKDLTGKTYGRLTVLGYVGTESEYSLWLCQCSCGKQIVTQARHLNYGSTQSCGCYQKDRFREAVDGKTTTHGYANKVPEYRIWKDIRRRCTNPRNQSYKNYGARGIKVCERWSDFASFLSDMGPRPSPKHTVERIDNDGDYCPENCRWASKHEQANNTRKNVYYEHDGRSLTLAQWAREYGLNYQTLTDRIKKGMSTAQALTTPLMESKRR